MADRDEFCRKCLLLLAACGVLAVFVRDGELSYTGTGLLMLLFVLQLSAAAMYLMLIAQLIAVSGFTMMLR